MTERRILIDPPIDGYKTEAVYKIPSQGDYYLSSDHKVNVLRSREDDLLHPNELKIILHLILNYWIGIRYLVMHL